MPPRRTTYLTPFQCRQALKDIRAGMSKTQLSLKYHCHWEQLEHRLRSYNEPLFEEAMVIREGAPTQVSELDKHLEQKRLCVRTMAEFDAGELADMLAKVVRWKLQRLGKDPYMPQSWAMWGE